ncbi:MAG: ribonuclease H family protein [Paludibacteraceae bacterium]|nr:ribonuclease H family protein [Paludibacteraceae bacterium]
MKFYVVWQGRETGIFTSWEECKPQIEDYKGAQYKSFKTREEAEQAFAHSYYAAINKDKKTDVKNSPTPPFIKNSIAVDAACSGNPGDMEYRGVNVFNGQQLFLQGVYKEATNNIGEFLAIVHGLALLKKQNSDWPIYSDSITAISWIKAKKCKTKLERTENNAEVFARIEAAEKWLATNTYTTKIYKWDTKAWGEIPADFGRK